MVNSNEELEEVIRQLEKFEGSIDPSVSPSNARMKEISNNFLTFVQANNMNMIEVSILMARMIRFAFKDLLKFRKLAAEKQKHQVN